LEDEVEKRFPRLMLAQLKRREKAITTEGEESSAQSVVTARAENMAVLLALSQVHLPTLDKWVGRQDR